MLVVNQVTGLAWAYDGRCLYSCSQDNTLHSWILDGNSIHEVPLPSNILGTKISSDVPNVSDACFGIAVSPANLVVAVFSPDGSPQLLLSTGCSDGSVKVWRGYVDDLLKSTEDGHAPFSLLKEVINAGSAPTSALSLIVPETSPHKIVLAIGKGSGSLEVWINDTSIDKFQVFGPLYDHDQIVTGLAWAYDGRCLYSCSQVMDVSEMLHTYLAKIRYAERNFLSTVDCEASRIGVQQEQNGDYDFQPMEDITIQNKGKKQKLQDYRNPPLINAQQYASRSAMVSSIVVAWSPMIHTNSSRSCCSIPAIGSKSGNISFWRVHQPQCYSVTQQSKPPVVTLTKVLDAHNSWITSISWSKFSPDGSPQLLLSTGCSDGSVKVWRGYVDDLLKSTEDGHAPFSLLKEVINAGSAPTSALSLIVPETSPHKIVLAIGKGSGSLEVWINDTSIDKFQVFGPLYDHDQIVPNVSDACFGIAVSPANLVVAVVRSFDVNLLNPMYQARSLKAAVEFFWIGGQKLQKDQQSDDKNFPGFPNMDLVDWGHNVLWSLTQYEHLKNPLVVWDIISALSDFKKSEPSYVGQMLVKWLILTLGFEWGPSIGILLQQVYRCLSNLTSRQLHLINLISRHVVLIEAKLTNTNGESDKEEPKLWVKLLEMSEKELRERLIGCSFLATINGCNANWQVVGLAQMRQWVAKNDCKDYVKLLASEVKKIEKRCVAEEECSYCSAPVVFQDTEEVAYCQADKCSKDGVTQKHKLERCAVSMTVCPLTPSWFCVSCNRWVSNLAPENLFTLLRYPPTVDSEERVTLMHNGSSNGKIFSKPFCPFCGVLLQRMQPEFLLSPSPV
nr:hypothetical protein [Tanacetum cinerariifolium]